MMYILGIIKERGIIMLMCPDCNIEMNNKLLERKDCTITEMNCWSSHIKHEGLL